MADIRTAAAMSGLAGGDPDLPDDPDALVPDEERAAAGRSGDGRTTLEAAIGRPFAEETDEASEQPRDWRGEPD